MYQPRDGFPVHAPLLHWYKYRYYKKDPTSTVLQVDPLLAQSTAVKSCPFPQTHCQGDTNPNRPFLT